MMRGDYATCYQCIPSVIAVSHKEGSRHQPLSRREGNVCTSPPAYGSVRPVRGAQQDVLKDATRNFVVSLVTVFQLPLMIPHRPSDSVHKDSSYNQCHATYRLACQTRSFLDDPISFMKLF
jgi:hypothetical protein